MIRGGQAGRQAGALTPARIHLCTAPRSPFPEQRNGSGTPRGHTAGRRQAEGGVTACHALGFKDWVICNPIAKGGVQFTQSLIHSVSQSVRNEFVEARVINTIRKKEKGSQWRNVHPLTHASIFLTQPRPRLFSAGHCSPRSPAAEGQVAELQSQSPLPVPLLVLLLLLLLHSLLLPHVSSSPLDDQPYSTFPAHQPHHQQ